MQELVQDFTLEVMRKSVEGGPYSYAAELEPGEELRVAFMHWVLHDPLQAAIDDRCRRDHFPNTATRHV